MTTSLRHKSLRQTDWRRTDTYKFFTNCLLLGCSSLRMTNLDSQPQQQHRLTSDVIFLHISTLPPLSLALEGETEIRNAVVTAVTLRPEMLRFLIPNQVQQNNNITQHSMSLWFLFWKCFSFLLFLCYIHTYKEKKNKDQHLSKPPANKRYSILNKGINKITIIHTKQHLNDHFNICYNHVHVLFPFF